MDAKKILGTVILIFVLVFRFGDAAAQPISYPDLTADTGISQMQINGLYIDGGG